MAVARALASRPEIIFGDEPTGNLDSRSSGEVLGILRRSVSELGQTVVIVTHEPHAASYADRVIFLADGRIVDELRDPTAESVLDRMKKLEELVKKVRRLGFGRSYDVGATEYYRLEGEAWLEQAR